MRLVAAIHGDLKKIMKEEQAAAEKAVTLGVVAASKQLKSVLRAQVVNSGLGEKMARTWKLRRYPASGYSLGTAGLVYADMPQVIRAFNDASTIVSGKGAFLAIPTPAAPKRGVGGKRINPSNFPEHTLGRLRFVYRRGAPSLLVVDNLRASTGKRGGYRKASESARKSGRGITTVIMFILLPQVSLRKRLNVEVAAHTARDILPQMILDFWETTDER